MNKLYTPKEDCEFEKSLFEKNDNHVKKKIYIQENFCQWYKHFFKMNKEKFLNNKLRKKSNLWNSIEYAFSIDWLAGQSLT